MFGNCVGSAEAATIPLWVQLHRDNRSNPLSWLRVVGDNGKLLKLSLILQQYDFTIQHKKGIDHGIADGLSRQDASLGINIYAIDCRLVYAGMRGCLPLPRLSAAAQDDAGASGAVGFSADFVKGQSPPGSSIHYFLCDSLDSGKMAAGISGDEISALRSHLSRSWSQDLHLHMLRLPAAIFPKSTAQESLEELPGGSGLSQNVGRAPPAAPETPLQHRSLPTAQGTCTPPHPNLQQHSTPASSSSDSGTPLHRSIIVVPKNYLGQTMATDSSSHMAQGSSVSQRDREEGINIDLLVASIQERGPLWDSRDPRQKIEDKMAFHEGLFQIGACGRRRNRLEVVLLRQGRQPTSTQGNSISINQGKIQLHIHVDILHGTLHHDAPQQNMVCGPAYGWWVIRTYIGQLDMLNCAQEVDRSVSLEWTSSGVARGVLPGHESFRRLFVSRELRLPQQWWPYMPEETICFICPC
ncbi:unnamed protein product [Ranitomeya imitator]|uniref:DUF4283 domain-containing protein n=1 Tax=Ranitomeya imitator TaxID=111125 RepID=A0ABN9KYZ6_9NEOB|nr:unnamed protein product [Ranitomeya imitator]